jgi:hypothetical protein
VNGSVGRTSSRPNYGEAGKMALLASVTSNFKNDKLSRLDYERMLTQGGEGSEGLAASYDTKVIGPIGLMLQVT